MTKWGLEMMALLLKVVEAEECQYIYIIYICNWHRRVGYLIPEERITSSRE